MSQPPANQHHAFMQQALRLAEQGLGQVWPNPSVGAVIVKNGAVISVGRTAEKGRPHAEPLALTAAGSKAKGATLYVTLEPCNHQGQTPPCTEAIIQAGIAQVVVACQDLHSKVNGQGIDRLRNAGITVIEGICQADALELNRGFFSTITRARPWVTMKVATSADGCVATANGQSQWITGEASRRHGHLLRATNDAILTGIGTVLADNPRLTCRLPGCELRSPVRVVLDRQNVLPEDAAMLHDGGPEVWRYGAEHSLPQILENLAERGITRLMIEAGPRINSALLKANLVDELYWYRAPIVIGNSGLAVFADEITSALSEAFSMRITHEQALGPDRLTCYRPTTD